TAHQCIDLIHASGRAVEPNSYDVTSNGREQAVGTRPQPQVREDDCVGCRLCYIVCPVEQCIQMVDLPHARESVTWYQLVASQHSVTEDWDAMKRYREKMGIHIH